jgi:D-tyrosyl-tRNA(Tyr) deacylase
VRVVAQRVSRGEVRSDGAVTGKVGTGFVLLVAFSEDDDGATLAWVADKIAGLRVFPDDEGRMNRGADEVEAGFLVVSQFTLYGDVSRGRRPSFVGAAAPEVAEALYHRFVGLMEERAPGRVATGSFGALMEVELVNDGPVTLVIDR